MSLRDIMTAWLMAAGMLCAAAGSADRAAATRPCRVDAPLTATRPALADRIGCAHVKGAYHFTEKDFLNEGADVILGTGMRVIKVFLTDPRAVYPFHSDWPTFDSLVAMAGHRHFRDLFDKDFTTYVLTAFALKDGRPIPWKERFTAEDEAEVTRAFDALARHLLTTYRGTGKTFVLQNWEGDWASRRATRPAPEYDAAPEIFERMIRWTNARQEGVNRARGAVGCEGVRVYHACEVNLVELAMQGRPTVTNNVVPHTRCDLYSYSAYDTIRVSVENPKKRGLFRRALDYLADKAPDSPAFGEKNVYIGEFGRPSVHSEQDPTASTEKSLRVIRSTVETALDWGCPYVVYWQVYDNETRAGDGRPTNEQVRGFYLIKPDGHPAAAYDYFVSLLKDGGRSATRGK